MKIVAVLAGLDAVVGKVIVDEPLLDIEIADTAGGAAKPVELAQRLRSLRPKGWKTLETAEKIKMGFDAAAFGAQLVNGMRCGFAKADDDGRFQRDDVLAKR